MSDRNRLPEDLLSWLREAEDNYSHQKGEQDDYAAGAIDMYWHHCHGVENPTRLSFIKFAFGCMNERDRLQKKLASARKLIEDIKLSNHYPEATDLCERWLRENPDIK